MALSSTQESHKNRTQCSQNKYEDPQKCGNGNVICSSVHLQKLLSTTFHLPLPKLLYSLSPFHFGFGVFLLGITITLNVYLYGKVCIILDLKSLSFHFLFTNMNYSYANEYVESFQKALNSLDR